MEAPARIHLAPGVSIAKGDLAFATSRAGGPGGQHVNTTESRVQLELNVAAIQGLNARARDRLRAIAGTGPDDLIRIVCAVHRSQSANKSETLERLGTMVVEALPEPLVRRAVKVSRAAKRRRVDNKRKDAARKSGRRGVSDDG